MKKILVTGNAGSGKTFISNKLHSITGIQRYCLDSIVWKPEWQVTSTKEKNEKIKKIIENEKWIIDGVSLDVQREADCVIFLDCSRRISFFRTLKRNIPYMFKSRPDLPKNCPEIKIIPKLMAIIWNFPYTVKPLILKNFNQVKKQEIYHLKTRKEVNKFIENIF
ncbi:MAG: hypothetical protein GY857_20660 [Desulfobacula sp.]|nr:hypothetical protein [Desulfobacula sp.]